MSQTTENNLKQNRDNTFALERDAMVRNQIEGRKVTDEAVLNAMRKVPRHLFLAEELWPYAYSDGPLPIGNDQTISQPFIVAYMTEALELNKSSRVLEVGTGSGYQAAILAEICDSVYTIEVIANLGHRADSVLRDLGYENITVKVGDGYKGWAEHAPFDAIIVTCAPTEIPEPLIEQLAEGGRMIIPYGDYGYQKLMLVTKKDGKIRKEDILAVRFVPMVDEEGKRY